MKKQLLLIVAMLLPMVASAYDIAVENAEGIIIYYTYINNSTELQVTYKSYSASGRYGSNYTYTYYGYENVTDLVIPDEVTYMGRTRKVTSIGYNAFKDFRALKSVTIPNSVTSIGTSFEGCTGLSSIVIGDNVKSIGTSAFKDCSALTSINIPNSVTSIGSSAFYGCKGLKSVTLSNNIAYIDDFVFYGCASLESIIIPDGVTGIGEKAFTNCSNITSIIIPTKITTIGESAFSGCISIEKIIVNDIAAWCGINFMNYASNPLYDAKEKRLYYDEDSEIIDLVIPNGVTSISKYAFERCTGLKTLTIGSNVNSIGEEAFYLCSNLVSIIIPNSVRTIENAAFNFTNNEGLPVKIISQIMDPQKISNNTFSTNVYNNASLFVPEGTIDKYKACDGWRKFVFIEEGTGGETIPTIHKCATPTISYRQGKLAFNCATDGATCQYSITDTDIKSESGDEVQLTATYTISVYAKKVGCENSETATATLCWIDVEPKTEGITNGIAQVPAKVVLIQTTGGTINVQGCDDGEQVGVYSINGSQIGTAVSQNGAATVNTTLKPGSVAIIKVGEKSIKVVAR